MSNMFRPADIADIWGAALNDIAVAKYNASEITDKIVFYVTADYQLYERLQKGEFELDDNQLVTPVIIGRTNHNEIPADYLRYEESYSVEVYGYADQLISLEKIFKEFTVQENTTNKSVVISPFRITKEQEDVSFGIELDPMDGTLDKRIQGSGSFIWSFLDGVMTSYDITIQIDGEEMPYISYDFLDSMGTIQSETIDVIGKTSSIASNSFYEMILVLPYISTSTVIKSLYREFYEGVYNKKHTLSYYDTALNETFTFDVVINNKQFQDDRPKILDFAITFKRVYTTYTIEIDDVEIPSLSFNMKSGSELSTTTKINESASASAHLGDSFQIDMSVSLADQTNTKVQELYEQVMNYDYSTPHILRYTKGSYIKDYDVLLNNGSYIADVNADEMITLTFLEADGGI